MLGRILFMVLLGGLLALLWQQRKRLVAMWLGLSVFIGEIRQEMKKVSWPPRDEVIGNTIVVLTMVAIISLLIGVEDQILAKVIQGMFRLGR